MIKEYKYILTEDHFIDFQMHYLKSNIKLSVKKTIIILAALYIIVFSSSVLYFRGNAFMISAAALLILLFSVIQILTYKKRLEKRIIKKVREYIRSGKLDKVLGIKELIIYDDKIVFKEERGASEFKRNEIKKIECTLKCIFFYTDDMSAIIIPKSCIKSGDTDFLL
ncbi:YcxB family protein [uncultured Brachyspira sp.]|uniref:YcxB family protein n=1 Tax=uncultured Brachyspira sp. TaxID=221953 RepID=UPI0025E8F121|nr:YcxB family protein [uncultured Brachyspira sp.]